MIVQKILKILVLFLLVNCAASRLEITDKTSEIFAKNGMSSKIYQTKNFQIFTAQKILDSKQDLRVYFEGGGKAFQFGEASQDTTPTSYFLANLIAEDNFSNILYVARPCQYVTSKNCEEKYWTDARFAPEIIDAIDEVLEQFSDKKIQVIGYSGGGAILIPAPISFELQKTFFTDFCFGLYFLTTDLGLIFSKRKFVSLAPEVALQAGYLPQTSWQCSVLRHVIGLWNSF